MAMRIQLYLLQMFVRFANVSEDTQLALFGVHTAGTVVKHKRGKLLADLANPGDEILVARGGQGGVSQ